MDLAPAHQPHPPAPKVVNGLSVDVEDWFQVGAFETTIERGDWDGCELRVERNVETILALFERAGVKATFFTLGWVAERVPQAIRAVVDAGHELASHGYDHQRVFTFAPSEFAEDLRRSRGILEDIGGCKVTGYRAPSFSIDARTPWAHEELAGQGYAYSSSVAPIAHDHYGWRDAPRFAFNPVEGADLIELPVTTAMLGHRRLAAGGGVFYFHPWEVDPDQPRVVGAPLRSRLRHYTRLAAMEGKLERLLRDFAWGRMDEVAAAETIRTEGRAA